MEVRQIQRHEASEWFLHKHYAKRMPSIVHLYGLFSEGDMIGVVSYGIPASPNVCEGVCGVEYKGHVLELTRLVVNDNAPKNSASFLVGNTLRLLPTPKILLSYADTSQGHVGYIYQATNWIYTGLSAIRTDWKPMDGEEKAHSRHRQANDYRNMVGANMSDYHLVQRPRKHRYVTFVGNRRYKRKMRKLLKYPVEAYPKGESKRYDASYKPTIQQSLF